MIILDGTGIGSRTAAGVLTFYSRDAAPAGDRGVTDTAEELSRYYNAKAQAMLELERLHDEVMERSGKQYALIFAGHKKMLLDPGYEAYVTEHIRGQGAGAERAVQEASDYYTSVFWNMEDPYIRERAEDVRDVSNRLIRLLRGRPDIRVDFPGPVILASDDLMPSETVRLPREKILAIVTAKGSQNSHTAILARTMNIPAIVGIGDGLDARYEGKYAVVDALNGRVYIEPDPDIVEAMHRRAKKEEEELSSLLHLRGKPNMTLQGQKIDVFANIGSVEDVDAALYNDAGGIGLFRSEFLFLERDCPPSEEEQFAAYKEAARRMDGKKVIIRTVDVGGDKLAGYLGISGEENPALGMRGIRVCLRRPEIFKTQLRAILRASAYGQVAVMFPMIISTAEVREIRRFLDEVREELDRQGMAYRKDMEIGVMVETPAAVMISGELAQEVDFLSIGTNDLTQYALAVDRQNQDLSELYDGHHPAVLSMIGMTAKNAHAHGKWVGICGGIAADTALTETFIELGIDELSVAPSQILPLRKRIRKI